MRLALAAVLLSMCAVAHAQELDDAQDARYRALTQELRCLVCQNQSIADSSAPLAEDLRAQVKTQILGGKSNAEILEYVTARYGDFVLYRPRLKSNTALLWLAPVLLVLVGVVMALRLSASRRRRAQPASVDAAAVQRLLSADDLESP